MRFSVFFSILGLALVVVVALAGHLLLQACAVSWPPLARFGACLPQAERAAAMRLAQLDAEREDLARTVYALERELSALQCVAEGPDTTGPLVARGWENGSLGMLHGCWDVSLDYRTRDVDTDEVASYTEWQMCFDAAGQGRQRMRDNAGVTCEGAVAARYEGESLALVESGDLPCSDGGYIHRREISCRLAGDGGAVCATLQPETGGAADVRLSRAVR
jgi:hypothetical protein